jgi:phage tail protein X
MELVSLTEPRFQAWPKIPRMRNMIITEKIDGTNAAIGVSQHAFGTHVDGWPDSATSAFSKTDIDDAGMPNTEYLVWAQSRTRLIRPEDDNYGFARWVWDHADELAPFLGPGLHYGEWWGQGIQRRYGMTEKRFSLFNTKRWGWMRSPELPDDVYTPPQIDCVPILRVHGIDTGVIEDTLDDLMANGSVAAPGFSEPEGIVVYFPDVDKMFKRTERDIAKGQLALAA